MRDMSTTELTVDATLNADGSLELDRKLALSPGRVRVTVQKVPSTPSAIRADGDWWEAMQATRGAIEMAGCQFLDESEVSARIAQIRESDAIDDRLQDTP